MSNKSSVKRIGRPPGADADKTKAALLDAALKAFAERGFEGASIREITGSVGVGHNLVRHYFGSKDDLWRAAIGHGLEPAAARIIEMLDPSADQEFQSSLRAGLESLMEEVAANPDAFRLFLAEALRGGARFEQIYDDILEPISRAIFDYAKATGEIPPTVDLRVLGIFVFGAIFSPFSFEGLASRVGFVTPRDGEPLGRQADLLIEMIVAGMTRIGR